MVRRLLLREYGAKCAGPLMSGNANGMHAFAYRKNLLVENAESLAEVVSTEVMYSNAALHDHVTPARIHRLTRAGGRW